MLKFHTQEMPEMAEAGARYVVVAHYGEWRDGLATNYPAEIPKLQRELRKRFMNRLQLGTGMTPAPEELALRHSPQLRV
jgi:hypothetical protein